MILNGGSQISDQRLRRLGFPSMIYASNEKRKVVLEQPTRHHVHCGTILLFVSQIFNQPSIKSKIPKFD